VHAIVFTNRFTYVFILTVLFIFELISKDLALMSVAIMNAKRKKYFFVEANIHKRRLGRDRICISISEASNCRFVWFVRSAASRAYRSVTIS